METMIYSGRINVYFGKSTDASDPKSVRTDTARVPNGSIYHEMDTHVSLLFDEDNREWLPQNQS